jgi:hypothetical protein
MLPAFLRALKVRSYSIVHAVPSDRSAKARSER